MRYRHLVPLAAILVLRPCALFSASTLILPNANVGSNLETSAKISLSEPAPDQLDISVSSGDPLKLRISKSHDQPGAATILVRVRKGFRQSQEFWLQALGNTGSVTYTAEAPAFAPSTGTVTLTPSAIVIRGPSSIPKFITTPRSSPAPIRLTAVRLNASLKIAEEQFVAGGVSVPVDVISSRTAVGTIGDSHQEIKGGTNAAVVMFKPSAEGNTDLSVVVPGGFSTPAEFATVTAEVQKPGLAVSTDVNVGENLEVGGVLLLAEPPPEGGVDVTLVSEDPSLLLLSNSAIAIGSKSITVKMMPDGKTGAYYLQALRHSGQVKYTASAPGYRSRTGVVTLTPSGGVFTPASHGPPDEAHVLRPEGAGPHAQKLQYPMNLSTPAPIAFAVWMVQLDTLTHRGADITVQPLRAGLSVTVPLTNSEPAVGKIAPSVTIQGGSDHGLVYFTPLSAGSTEVSVTTPKGFTPAANSTTIIAIVSK
jgi:hypothetical protein